MINLIKGNILMSLFSKSQPTSFFFIQNSSILFHLFYYSFLHEIRRNFEEKPVEYSIHLSSKEMDDSEITIYVVNPSYGSFTMFIKNILIFH